MDCPSTGLRVHCQKSISRLGTQFHRLCPESSRRKSWPSWMGSGACIQLRYPSGLGFNDLLARGVDAVDIKSPEERSRNMAAVKSRNTSPEIRLRRAIWKVGVRYFTSAGWFRLTGRRLPGSPDLVFPSARVVVFVDGCFWHGCPKHYQLPDTRQEFWRAKLLENQRRDRKVTELLEAEGWRVVRIWEHDTTSRRIDATVATLVNIVRSPSSRCRPTESSLS